MTRPVWNKETMSARDYQDRLVSFLQVDLPYYQFAPSNELIRTLERLADAEEEIEMLRGIISHQDAKLVEGSTPSGGAADGG